MKGRCAQEATRLSRLASNEAMLIWIGVLVWMNPVIIVDLTRDEA